MAFNKNKFAPHMKRLSELASTNLFVLALRLIQFFFSGVVLGIMAYYIDLQRKQGRSASSPFVFSLVVAIISMATQFLYCFSYEHNFFWLWDEGNAIAWLLAFFWLLNFVGGSLPCGWSSFNPFGSDRCAQTRSVLVIQIIMAVSWVVTGAFSAFKVWKHKGHHARKVEMDV